MAKARIEFIHWGKAWIWFLRISNLNGGTRISDHIVYPSKLRAHNAMIRAKRLMAEAEIAED
jgi:hypothetical protein